MGGKAAKMYEKRKINAYNKKYNKNYKYNKNIYSIYNDNYENNYKKQYKFNSKAVKLRYLDTNSKHLTPEIKHSYVYKGVPGGW